jgi:hypothetical protein
MKTKQMKAIGYAMLVFLASTVSSHAQVWSVDWPWIEGSTDGEAYTNKPDAQGNLWSAYAVTVDALDDPEPDLASDWQVDPCTWTNTDSQWRTGSDPAVVAIYEGPGTDEATVLAKDAHAGYVIEVATAGEYDFRGTMKRNSAWSGGQFVRFGTYRAGGKNWQELARFEVPYDTTIDLEDPAYDVPSVELKPGDLLTVGFRGEQKRMEMGGTVLVLWPAPKGTLVVIR